MVNFALGFNIWVILIAVVFNMVLGMLWYGPFFGKPWMKGMGWDPDKADEIKEKQKSAWVGYVFSMIFAAFFGYALNLLLAIVPGLSLGGALLLTLVIYLGLVATNTVKTLLWGEIKPVVFFIGMGYELVSFLVLGTAAYYL